MSESQSRYSIVERLTRQKLDIMGAKIKLKEDIKAAEQEYDMLKETIEDRKSEVDSRANIEKRELDRSLKNAEHLAKNLKERQDDKNKGYDEKIKEIDDALIRISDISKSSVQPES